MLGSTRHWAQHVLLALSIPLGLASAFRLWCSGDRPLKVTLPELAMAGFLCYLVGHYFVAPSEVLARAELLLVSLYAAVFWTTSRHLPSARHAHSIGWLVVLLTAGTSVYGILQYMQGNVYIAWGVLRAEQYGLRAGGLFNCPNHFAGYLEMGLGLALGFLFFAKMRWAVRLFLVVAVLAMIGGIVLSVSRGGWIATGGMFVFLAGMALGVGRIPKWVPVVAVLLVGGVGWTAFENNDLIRSRFEQMVRSDEGGISFTDIRLTLYRDALTLIEMKPWTGHGPATFEFMHPRVQSPHYYTRAVYVHGDYLNLLTDYGIIGGGIASVFLLGLAISFWLMRRKVQTPMDSGLLAGASAALVVMLLHAVVEFNLHIPANALTLFAVVGAALGVRREPVLAFSLSFCKSRVVAAGVLGFTLLFSWVVVRSGVGCGFYYFAAKQMQKEDTSSMVALCERSLRWDPRQANAALLLGDFWRSKTLSVPTVRERDELALKAIGYYERARKANPWLIESFNKMSLCYDIMEQRQEAWNMLQQALRLEPYGRPVHRLIADHLWRWGYLDDARKHYEYVLWLYGGDEEARENLNRLNQLQSQPQPVKPSVPGRVVNTSPQASSSESGTPPVTPEVVPAPSSNPAPSEAAPVEFDFSLSPKGPSGPLGGMSSEPGAIPPLP
jgi:O-antigen ligase